jgi:fatty-acyl-CoA synthase
MSLDINIGWFLTKRAILSPEKEGLVCDEQRFTYKELNQRANRLANMMLKMGIRKGDRIALLALNVPEYYDLLFGLGKIGAILVPINYRLAGPEMSYIIKDSEARAFVFGEEYTDIVDSFRNDLPTKDLICISKDAPSWAWSYEKLVAESSDEEPALAGSDDDTLTILYTSGTTGRPKGSELTHANYFWTSVTMITTLGETGDRTLVALPLFHIGALGGIPLFVHMGLTAILLRSFDAKRFLELIPNEKVTGMGVVPQVLQFLKLIPEFSKDMFATVKIILVYAAPVPVPLLKEYAEAGIEVRQLYGMTECTGPATVLDSENAIAKAGSCGLPMFHTEIKVVREDGAEVEPEDMGEVLIRSKNVMKGYWNNPEETDKTIVDGWLHSGDIAKKDKDGFLYIMDRKKDMIISGGENIYPAEIEEYLMDHPKIADVGVIGYPHQKWGEAVKAVVVLKSGEQMTEDELKEWCKGKIAKYKTPKSVVFTDALPRTPTGKILKRELRTKFN